MRGIVIPIRYGRQCQMTTDPPDQFVLEGPREAVTSSGRGATTGWPRSRRRTEKRRAGCSPSWLAARGPADEDERTGDELDEGDRGARHGFVLLIVTFGHLLKEPLYEFHTHVIPRLALVLFVLVLPRDADRFSIDAWLARAR